MFRGKWKINMAKIKPGLGKGLDLLIPEEEGDEKKDSVLLRISEIEPNSHQPRKNFNEDSLKELADSIKAHGVIEPIIVRDKKDYYEIVAGERRWRAARMAGLKEIPALIREYSDSEISEIALIENIQREDLTPLEEARAYKTLIDEYKLTQEELSSRISKSRAAIANSMRLLKLDEKVQAMLEEGSLTAGHARALLSLEEPEDQLKAAREVIGKNLSVRETEDLVKKWNTSSGKKEKKPSEKDLVYRDLEEKIEKSLGTKVKISNKDNGTGKIEINYYSDDELERIYEIISRGAKER